MMYWLTTHFEITIVVLLTLLAAIVILQQRRTPQSTAAWLLFIVALPWVAVPVFLALGFRKHSQRFNPVDFCRGNAAGLPPVPAHPLDETFQHYGLPAASHGQTLRLLESPDAAYHALMAMIDSARDSVSAMFYIVASDDTGESFVDALTARAQAGVKVRLLLDRLGTLRGPAAALRRLRAAGGEIFFYSPLLQLPGPGHLNLRNHRKMIIVDGVRVFSGGMNMGAHYLSAEPHEDAWTDLAFVLAGSAVQSFSDVFRSDWEVASGQTLAQKSLAAPGVAGTATVQLVPSGPDVKEDPLHDGLIRALHMAQTRIWIVTPYFVPTETLGNALSIAARRGVDVRLMVPAHSNQRLADFARGGYLREMQEAGAQVLYFQPGMLHAKAGIIDDVGYVGSANFDVRSMLLNFETVLFCYDAGTVAELADWFARLSEQCDSSETHPYLARRVAEGLFRLGAPIL